MTVRHILAFMTPTSMPIGRTCRQCLDDTSIPSERELRALLVVQSLD